MPCFCPLDAYYGERTATGKRAIVFKINGSHSGVKLKIPCGQCVGCRLERSRQWAMRCLHENKLHEVSCFLTLTYDDDHLPEGGTLVKRDLQLFMKRLRKAKGKVRFYACGEYGDRTRRPHYHVLLFGCHFADKRKIRETKAGYTLYYSKELEKLWPYGQNTIGDVTFESAAYCARYVMKKVTGERAEAHYEYMDSDGVVRSRVPEFTVMSRRPGIGSGWFDKYGNHAYEWDSVVINGREVRPPRYYDGRYEVVDGPRMAMLKCKRRRQAMRLSRIERGPDRRRVKEVVTIATLAQKRSVL